MKERQTYVVKPGDNLYKIAEQFNTTVLQLMELNQLQNTTLSIGQILVIGKGEYILPDVSKDYETYLKENQGKGILKVHVLVGNTKFPLSDASVTISKALETETKEIYHGKTGESGILDEIMLAAPIRRTDYLNGASIYQLEISHPNYHSVFLNEIYIYDGIKSIQVIEMFPKFNPFQEESDYGR